MAKSILGFWFVSFLQQQCCGARIFFQGQQQVHSFTNAVQGYGDGAPIQDNAYAHHDPSKDAAEKS